MNSITENEIEAIALGYLQSLGYGYLNGLVISSDGEHPERQYTDVVLTTRLRDAIDKLNPTLGSLGEARVSQRTGLGYKLSPVGE